MFHHCSSHWYKVYIPTTDMLSLLRKKNKRLTICLDGEKMFTGQRWRGYMTRRRREPQRNVPPGIPVFSPVRFSSGPLPYQAPSWFSPPLHFPSLSSCRAYQLHRERETGGVGSTECGSITNTAIYRWNIEANWRKQEPRAWGHISWNFTDSMSS
jgi:hypothetical protein